jgi:excisionase family DNA binding protein
MASVDPHLRTQQVAQALGVGVSTVKRWVDRGVLNATRTVGKHRLIPRSEAVRVARRLKLPIAGLGASEGPEATVVDRIDDGLRDRLTESLRRGDAARATAMIRGVVASGLGGVALADQVIRPVMERIGHGWEVGDLDVFQEHRASHIVTAALIELIDRAASRQDAPAPLALGATPEGDFYQIALLLGELVLRELGWEVRNLSVNLPMRSLSKALGACRSRLVYLSVSHLVDEDRFAREYQAFFEAATSGGIAVILGGRALGPDLRARLGYASFGERMAHLSEFARQLGPLPAPADAATSSTATRIDRPGTPPARPAGPEEEETP